MWTQDWNIRWKSCDPRSDHIYNNTLFRLVSASPGHVWMESYLTQWVHEIINIYEYYTLQFSEILIHNFDITVVLVWWAVWMWLFYCFFFFLQAEETETCPLTLHKSTNDEPLILFLIDINTLRCVPFTTRSQSVYYCDSLIWTLYNVYGVFV